MFKAIINFIYLLLIKSAQSNFDNSMLEVDAAINKIVIFDNKGYIKK